MSWVQGVAHHAAESAKWVEGAAALASAAAATPPGAGEDAEALRDALHEDPGATLRPPLSAGARAALTRRLFAARNWSDAAVLVGR